MIVETSRLQLRPIALQDQAAFRGIYGDPSVMQHMFGGAKSADDSDKSVVRKCEHWQTHGYGLWSVIYKENGALIGHCGLGWLEPLDEVEVAYLLAAPYWGRGLGSEAVRASLDHGFGHHGFARIVAIAPPENLGSLRVMERCGMRRVGERMVWNRTFICCEALKPQA